jgi:biotin carboxylase
MAAPLLHILGGGQWQVPTIRLAKEMGLRVLVTDLYEQRPGYALADLHERIDLTDREGTLEAARRHRVDGIVCDTTDVGVPTAAYVAEQLGLPGPGLEVALDFTDKQRMRRRLLESGVVTDVAFRAVSSGEEARAVARAFGLPVVIKPADSQSSRGVRIVRREDDACAAFEHAARASRSRSVLVEEFLPGTEATVESISVGGELHVLGISDKAHYLHRPEVARRLTYPADFAPAVMARIERLHGEVVRGLGLRDGVCHAEYMVDGETVRLVEIAARGGGSRIHSHITPWLSGLPVPRLVLEMALGRTVRAAAPARRSRAANLSFPALPAGKVRRIAGLDEARALPGVAEVLFEFAPGDNIAPPEDDRSRPALLLVLGESRDEVLATAAAAERMLRVDVEP